MPKLFGGGSAPPTPQVAVAPPMPDQQSPQVIEAQNKAGVAAQQRAGRGSTVLGRNGPPTAADTYAATKLGTDA